MVVKIIAVHPTVTMVRTDEGQTELPTGWFPTMPVVGQSWTIDLDHQPTDTEKLDQLNDYLVRD